MNSELQRIFMFHVSHLHGSRRGPFGTWAQPIGPSGKIAPMSLDRLADRINSVSRLTGTFTLRSGQIATEYFDKYRFEALPDLLGEIADAMVPLVPAGTEVLAGLEMGGIPIATALSMRTGLPTAFVRKEAKKYGTAQLAEGADVAGRHVTVVEDVITTGGQVVISSNELRSLGARVAHVVCVIDRSADGGAALAAEGLAMHALLTRAQLDAAEARRG
ncbi:MAG: orotate phosphoribosyltransferase [Actinomycetota bacterium]|jgi:orotate phosphoribosyltransferase